MSGNRNSGRRALPANVHVLRGNPSKKSAAELRAVTAHSPLTVAVPPCPSFLTADARIEWKRILADLKSLGMVSRLDRAELAVYCQAWADWKTAREHLAALNDKGFIEETPNGYKQVSAWMQIANRAEERLRAAGGSFGFSPSARSKLGTPAVIQGELFQNEQAKVANKYF